MNFMVGGAMIGGFALAAAPAQYRVTGVQTFIVSYEGVVYQKDLGPDTLKSFKDMELYNPDKTWRVTNEQIVASNPISQVAGIRAIPRLFSGLPPLWHGIS
jgi:hypothetical protein